METITLSHFAQFPLRAGLFADVGNAAFLRQQLLEGNAEFEYAFLDASVLLSRKHVLAACARAINDNLNGRLKTRNIHAEIVFSFSPNNNISESFRRFGIQESTKNILAVKVGGDASQIDAHLGEHVQGQLLPFTNETLAAMMDPARLRKIYKVDFSQRPVTPAALLEAEAFILGSMALKGS